MPTNNVVTLAKIQTAGQRQDKTVDYKDYYGHLRVAERYQPVDVTLTTTNTVQDLVTLSPLKAAVNWFTNPSFEADDISTAWTADGAAVSRVTTAARSGWVCTWSIGSVRLCYSDYGYKRYCSGYYRYYLTYSILC